MALLVVAGILVKQSRVLCARRSSKKEMAGCWEFPGGKVESGESFEMALERELREELSVAISNVRYFHDNLHHEPDRSVHLHAYTANPLTLCKLGVDHDKLAWLPLESLADLNWSAADVPIVEKLMEEGLPNTR